MTTTQKKAAPGEYLCETLEIIDLPPFEGEHGKDAECICEYLRHLVETHQPHGKDALLLKIPSACELSSFFQCSEMMLLKILSQLAGQAYDYRVHGIDGPIFLKDPLLRRPHARKHHLDWSHTMF